MAAFRFVVSDSQEVTQTQWYDEVPPGNSQVGNAALMIGKLRAANPDAVIYTQHDERDARDLNAQ